MGAHRSTDSSQANLKKGSSILQEGGLTDRRGISIGPGKMSSNFEGNVTKAFKKLKSRRSDTATLKVWNLNF